MLTSTDPDRWEAEARALDSQIEAMVQRRDKLLRRVEIARGLQSLLDDEPMEPGRTLALVSPRPAQDVPIEPASVTAEVATDAAEPKTRGIWKGLITGWVYASGSGLSGVDLRKAIYADPVVSQQFEASDKGFYNALSRLQKSGNIIRHLGRYYSPAALEDHKRRVAAGEVLDVAAPETASAYSPMAEAVLDLVSSHPGISGSDIIRALRTDVEFNAALTPHSTGAYNVIARLAKRRQIDRRGSDCFPGPNMTPRDPASRWLGRGAQMTG